jgi:hypothetical protein
MFFDLENELSRSDDYDPMEILGDFGNGVAGFWGPAFLHFLTQSPFVLACIYTAWMHWFYKNHNG